jgi:hypothetical protein
MTQGVFQKATEVIIWLGESIRESLSAFQFLKDLFIRRRLYLEIGLESRLGVGTICRMAIQEIID